MIASFRFGYDTPITEEQAAALNLILVPGVELIPPDQVEEGKTNVKGWHSEIQTGSLEKTIRILGSPSSIRLEAMDYANPLLEIAERLSVIESNLADARFNEKVGVALPDNHTLSIRTTHVVYDSCTEELDAYLKEGWQIIAACPQENQRRPDYVLGHSDPDKRI